MTEKRYIEKSRLIEKTFDDGGSVINCGFPLDELEAIAENGYVNITIAKKREVPEKGNSHYAYKSEFKPKKDDEGLPF